MDRQVLLIGYLDQGNLGLGYLAAVLMQAGFRVEVIDIRCDPMEMLCLARSSRPALIGFSLIFQYHLPLFAARISFLRSKGVEHHITMGGHYPSLRHRDVFRSIPGLSSVVRFEGEQTLLELAERLTNGGNWRDIEGIAYRKEDEVIANPPRPLVEDLDRLPHPHRPTEPERILGMKAVSLLASRGCAHNCTFCSIREFYRYPAGSKVRRRRPREVVLEMKSQHEERGVSIFLFQDDDFPLQGRTGRLWLESFLHHLHGENLGGKVIWKISCRADEVDQELFSRLRQAGLYSVYLGLESGCQDGLQTLGKRLSVDDNLQAVSVLKEIPLLLRFGFMLFDPSSTLYSLRANLCFLEKVASDGGCAISFCKMLPYVGTPIEARLAEEGRLAGTPSQPDYRFLEPRMDQRCDLLMRTVSGWFQGPEAVSPSIDWAWEEVAVMERLFPSVEGLAAYQDRLRYFTLRANALLLQTTSGIVDTHEPEQTPDVDREILMSEGRRLVSEMLDARNRFIAENQRHLLGRASRGDREGTGGNSIAHP